MKSKLTIITLLGFITIMMSCNSSTRNKAVENKSISDNDKKQVEETDMNSKVKKELTTEDATQADLRALGFVKHLKTSESLSTFFNDNWAFIYQEDNRCEGATDGRIDNLKSTQIDSVITLQVKNDGDGWACDKKEPKIYNLDFNLKKKVAAWDRFKIVNYDNQEEHVSYIEGAGESDYLKLYYNAANRIVKLEYRSEDPG